MAASLPLSATPPGGPRPRPDASRSRSAGSEPAQGHAPASNTGGDLWQRDDVREAVGRAQDALTRLRFHEGLRRGWEEARAEAAVREAAALARLEGVRISVDDLRALSMRDAAGDGSTLRNGASPAPRDPGEALAVGIWRSQWHLTSTSPPLNARKPVVRSPRPVPALVAGLHRDVCSALVSIGRVEAASVAMPVDPALLRRVLAVASAHLPGVLAAAAVVAEFRAADVFSPGSLAVGGALARWILVERCVDPTAVAVISLADAEDAAGAGRALGGWMSGDEDAAAAWVVRFARGLTRGAAEGEDAALHVQAGRLG